MGESGTDADLETGRAVSSSASRSDAGNSRQLKGSWRHRRVGIEGTCVGLAEDNCSESRNVLWLEDDQADRSTTKAC